MWVVTNGFENYRRKIMRNKVILSGIVFCFFLIGVNTVNATSESFANETEEITQHNLREAVMRNTGSQTKRGSVWSNTVQVLTWRSYWVRNGIAESGRVTTHVQRGMSYDTYYYAWSYRTW